MIFNDRHQAGKMLADKLALKISEPSIVYALPRGGVIIGQEISHKLGIPLDLIITRKIGHPYNTEFALGAVSENGNALYNQFEPDDIDPHWISEETERQLEEAQNKRNLYLGGRKPLSCKGKTAILTDDGVATGLSMKVAINELHLHYFPIRIIVAIPVISSIVAAEFKKMGTEVVCLLEEDKVLGSVSAYYQDFSPIEDLEVMKIMKMNILSPAGSNSTKIN